MAPFNSHLKNPQPAKLGLAKWEPYPSGSSRPWGQKGAGNLKAGKEGVCLKPEHLRSLPSPLGTHWQDTATLEGQLVSKKLELGCGQVEVGKALVNSSPRPQPPQGDQPLKVTSVPALEVTLQAITSKSGPGKTFWPPSGHEQHLKQSHLVSHGNPPELMAVPTVGSRNLLHEGDRASLIQLPSRPPVPRSRGHLPGLAHVPLLPQNPPPGASLMAQWLRIRLPMEGTWVRALAGKIPHAAEQLSPCATTTEPVLQSLRATTPEPRRLEPVLCNKRSHRNEKPMRHNEE